jgi:hypothetical protein
VRRGGGIGNCYDGILCPRAPPRPASSSLGDGQKKLCVHNLKKCATVGFGGGFFGDERGIGFAFPVGFAPAVPGASPGHGIRTCP